MSARKERSDSGVKGLPQNLKDAIDRWLFEENVSYAEASKRCWADFNRRVSKNSIETYFKKQGLQRQLDRIAASRNTSNQVQQQFRRNPADMYQVLLDMVGQIAFEKAMESGEKLDAETIFNFAKLVIQGKKEARADARLKLDQEKFEIEASKKLLDQVLRKRAEEIATSNLSNEDKIAAMRKAAFSDVDELQKSGTIQLPE